MTVTVAMLKSHTLVVFRIGKLPPGRIFEMVMMLLVLASLFFVAPLCRALMRRAQIGCAARIRAHGAQRNQLLDIPGIANRAGCLGTRSPLEMLKLMSAL